MLPKAGTLNSFSLLSCKPTTEVKEKAKDHHRFRFAATSRACQSCCEYLCKRSCVTAKWCVCECVCESVSVCISHYLSFSRFTIVKKMSLRIFYYVTKQRKAEKTTTNTVSRSRWSQAHSATSSISNNMNAYNNNNKSQTDFNHLTYSNNNHSRQLGDDCKVHITFVFYLCVCVSVERCASCHKNLAVIAALKGSITRETLRRL